MNKPLNKSDLLAQYHDGVDLLTMCGFETDPTRIVAKQETVKPPLHLSGSVGRAAAFPVKALGLRGGATVKAFHKLSQAPLALCAQSVLCAMSTTVSSWGQVEAIHGDTLPISLYLITVAQSGERKTTADKLSQPGIKAFQAELAQQLERLNRQESKSNGHDSDERPTADILVNDPTCEGLLGVLARGRFACFANDDAASFFGGHSMSKYQAQRMIAVLSSLWSGGGISRPRAHGRDTVVPDAPLTMSLMFQPYLIGQVFGNREMVEQGLLPRVLPCFPESTMGTRFFQGSSSTAREVRAQFAEHVFKTLQELQTMKQARTEPKSRFDPAVPILGLSEGARAALIAFYNEIESGLGHGGKYEQIVGFASRATENATRLSAVITLFDDIRAKEVSVSAALSACELMRFYLEEFSFLLRLGKSEKDNSAVGELGVWMARQYGAGGIGHDKDVSQFAPPAFRKKGDRSAIMQILVAHHWIEMLPAGTVVDGIKRQEAFRVNPMIGDVI